MINASVIFLLFFMKRDVEMKGTIGGSFLDLFHIVGCLWCGSEHNKGICKRGVENVNDDKPVQKIETIVEGLPESVIYNR